MSDDITQRDLSLAVIDGASEGVVTLVEAIRRYGAADVQFGYEWPDEDTEPTEEDNVLWYCEATFPHRRTALGQPMVMRKERWSGRDHEIKDSRFAAMEAMADVIRALGGNVTLVMK